MAMKPKANMKSQLTDMVSNDMLTTMFPNLHTIATISLSIPVATASVERSFSQMKLMMTRLRSSSKDTSLSHLMKIAIESPNKLTERNSRSVEPKKQKSFSLINDSISCITCVIVYSPVHTLIYILLIYSVTDALNVYMYVMYLVFETVHMQELIQLHCIGCIVVSFQRERDCAKRGQMPPPTRPPLNNALISPLEELIPTTHALLLVAHDTTHNFITNDCVSYVCFWSAEKN